jgi:hypothetical protein
MQRRGRLAHRGANVGLERVTETAVRVAVRTERVENRFNRCGVQKYGQPVAVEQASIGENEPLGGIDVGHDDSFPFSPS